MYFGELTWKEKAFSAATAVRSTAAAQYLRVFAKNPELAAFLRKLDSLRTIMKGKTTVVLDTNTDPFTLLKSNADVLNMPAANTQSAK